MKAYQDDTFWKDRLAHEVYHVTRERGTEPAFSGKYYTLHDAGYYYCACCRWLLFSSEHKYDSGTGWPSFFQPQHEFAVRYREDNRYAVQQTEVICFRCYAHLGHVYDDGPAPTGKRYCMNSLALQFFSKDHQWSEAYFAAGCFWGVQKRFDEMIGVVSTEVGYAGGTVEHPTYKQVCTGDTGHAETVKVLFDEALIDYATLLNAFWHKHNPTTPNCQGPDHGSQYRSMIFVLNDEQAKLAEASKIHLNDSGHYSAPIVTEIVKFTRFYPAEDYHQQYLYKANCSEGC